MSIEKLNNRALEIVEDPTIIIGEMSLKDFEEWLEINDTDFDKRLIWNNLLQILIDYEMFEQCAIIKKKLDEN